VRPDVKIAEPQKVGTHRVVQTWNDAVRQNLDEQMADVAGSNKRVVQSGAVEVVKRWSQMVDGS